MADSLVSVATEICKCLAEPMKNQARYVYRFKSIIEAFREKNENLKLKQDNVQREVNRALQNTKEIEDDVKKWLTDASKAVEDARGLEEKIQENKSCFFGQCPNWIWQYKLGKKAEEKADTISKLLDKQELFIRISHPTTLGVDFLASKEFMPFESRNVAFNQIIEALKDEKVNLIGLHGMGGVGKTTLVIEAGKKVKELKLFDQVVIAVVSQNQDVKKIQGQIGDFLGFKLEEESEIGRAGRLSMRLKSEKEKILIILDDVWKDLDLTAVGIPSDTVKIVVTTRRLQVCLGMRSKKIISLNVLSDGDAMALFKQTANVSEDSPTLNNVVNEVVRECKGLPIAIVTVAKALTDAKTIDHWKLASQQLKNSRLVDIENVDDEKNAYASLKFSYDYLKPEKTKLCFLLCSLFPEDSKIRVEDLATYAIGLGLYSGFGSIDLARSEVRVAVENLKASSLLLETESEDHVKMHDVVRDFALWITSEDYVMDRDFGLWTTSKRENVFWVKSGGGLEEWPKNGNLEGCKAISLIETKTEELPSGLKCPMVEIFLLWKSRYSSLIRFSDEFFEEMKSVKVLTLERALLSKQSLQFFTNLRVLKLKYCKLDDISLLGNNRGQSGLNEMIFLTIENCNEMECLLNATQQQGSTIVFSNLKELNVQGMNRLRAICDGQPPKGFLQKLEILEVTTCPNMSIIFPAKLMQRLQNLKEVRVHECDKLQEVFQLEGILGVGEENRLLLSSLTKLDLFDLSELECIWKGPNKHISLQSLKVVEVWICQKLLYLFPSSLAQSLVQLEELEIHDCDELEKIIVKDEEEIGEDHHIREQQFSKPHHHLQIPLCFSMLTTLRIHS